MSDINNDFLTTVTNYTTARSGWKGYAKKACEMAIDRLQRHRSARRKFLR